MLKTFIHAILLCNPATNKHFKRVRFRTTEEDDAHVGEATGDEGGKRGRGTGSRRRVQQSWRRVGGVSMRKAVGEDA